MHNNNEKPITDFWNRKPKTNRDMSSNKKQTKHGLDEFDLQADREGKAKRYFNQNELRPVLGRRVGKETRKRDGYAKTAGYKSTKNLVNATVTIYKTIKIGEE